MATGSFDRHTPAPPTALRLYDVHKRFGATHALRGVNLSLYPGEVTALVGENGAGKSTLMNVVAGAVTPDTGGLHLFGNPVRFRSAAEARAAGIALIHQELSLFPHLTVAENIVMGSETSRRGWLDRDADRARVEEVLSRFSHPAIHPDRVVGRLPVAAQQVVEICRALVGHTRILLMDEPTSSLERRDIDRLFVLIDNLRKTGIAVVYISHFLEEVRAVADRFVVLRDGRDVGQGRVADTRDDDIVALMVGRTVDQLFPPRKALAPGRERLRVGGVATRTGVRDASLSVRAGEILGIAGIVGSGRSELLRALAGLDPATAGRIELDGQPVAGGGFAPARRIARGIGYLSEDRKHEGLALPLSIADNVTLSRLGSVSRLGLLSLARQRAAASQQIEALAIRAQGPAQAVGALSGGNQQKVALGRLLHQQAEVFLLDEPTRGVDIGSKVHIYRAIRAAADAGKTIIVVSSYLPELFGLCDRLAVMCRGVLSEARAIEDWSPEAVMAVATGAAGQKGAAA